MPQGTGVVTHRQLNLKAVYDSEDSDLVSDLIVPLLSCSTEYCRGVGYFSSGWLRLAARGLSQLAIHGGRARLIMSPILEERDWDAMQLGERAKEDDTLRRLLTRNLAELEQSLERDTLNTFAWMVADNLLDIRFAVPRRINDAGQYHDKVAFFNDCDGNTVAIHGSFNDSVQGTLNGEAFSVFCSWEGGHQAYVDRHVSRLNRLWRDESTQFRAFPIPEAVRRQIIALRTGRCPYGSKQQEPEVSLGPRISIPVKLHDYQEQAIAAWLNAGCRGIFEMATGTGKTFTALAAAVQRFHEKGQLALVILVPYLHLVAQWNTHCRRFGFRPIACHSAAGAWQAALRSGITDFRHGTHDLTVIAVHNTAAGEAFRRLISALPSDNTLLVGDEAHALGSQNMQTALLPTAGMRLGLTATPRRWYDDAGTQALLEYFGGVCYSLSLEDAISRGFLVPYTYHPILVTLTDAEEQSVLELTNRVAVLLSVTSERVPVDEEQLERLLRERARVLANAEAKDGATLDAILQHVQHCHTSGIEPKDILVYCAPGRHRTILQQVASLGLRCHDFVHDVSANDRQTILEDFSSGRLQALIAIRCLDEGVDVPSTRSAFFMASTTNPRQFIQRRGRILRKFPGKEAAQVWDCVVVPSPISSPEVAAFLLRREMPRFVEFAGGATNKYRARELIRPFLDKYGMLHLFDMKPWDLYHETLSLDRERSTEDVQRQ